MKGNTIYIVLGLVVLALIGFFVWRSSQRRKAEALAIQQQQQLMLSGGMNGINNQNQNGAGLAGTLDSVGGVINSLSGLFGSFGGWGQNNSGGNEQALIDQFTMECETMYNTNAEVNACVQSKLNSVT